MTHPHTRLRIERDPQRHATAANDDGDSDDLVLDILRAMMAVSIVGWTVLLVWAWRHLL